MTAPFLAEVLVVFLVAVALVVALLRALLRAVPDGHVLVAYLGGAMVLFGVTFAILQTDVRRLLSYHVVSQVGYMVAGFGAGATLASTGAMAHLLNNVLYKSLLFMVAGVLIRRTGTANLKEFGGAGRAMPLAAGAFAVAACSIAGVPGFNGFVSKGMVLDGVEKAGIEPLWYVLVLGGVGTVVSFAKFGYYAFLQGPGGEYADFRPLEVGALGALATLCVVIGVAPGLLFDLLPPAGTAAAKPFAGKQFVKAGAVVTAGLALFAVVRRPLSHVTPVRDLDAIYHPVGRRLQRTVVDGAVAIERGIDRTGTWTRDRTRAMLSMDVGERVPARSLPTDSIGAGLLAVVVALLSLLAILFV